MRYRWSNIYNGRLDWALNAYEEFLGGLDPEVRAGFADARDGATVVVFGRTQVGKTYLLLKLFGMRADCLDSVSLILRGESTAGNSSTATAMEYAISPDEEWYIRDPDRVRCTASELTARLKELRKAVEAGDAPAADAVRIDIPRGYFEEDFGFEMRIIDLPGSEPGNASEADHVRQLSNRYIPAADLVLLTGPSSELTFLQPAALQLPEFQDWRYYPHRFRVVTTYSFSPDSIAEYISTLPEVSASIMRERFLEQLGRFAWAKDLPKVCPQRLYPLEFGTSLTGLRNRNPDLYEKCIQVVDALLAQLRADIKKSASSLNRLKNAARCGEFAARIQSKTAMDMQDVRLRTLDERDYLRKKNDLRKRNIRSLEIRIDEAEAFPIFDGQKALHQMNLRLGPSYARLSSKSATDPSGAADLRAVLGEVRGALVDLPMRLGIRLAKHKSAEGGDVSAASYEGNVLEPVDRLRETLSGYWIDRYFSSDTKARDCQRVRAALLEARQVAEGLLISAKRKEYERWLAERAAQAKSWKRRVSNLQAVRKSRLLQRLGLRSKLRAQESEFLARMSRLNEDIERGFAFGRILRKWARSAQSERRAAYEDADSPVNLFLALADHLLLKQVTDGVLEHVDDAITPKEAYEHK